MLFAGMHSAGRAMLLGMYGRGWAPEVSKPVEQTFGGHLGLDDWVAECSPPVAPRDSRDFNFCDMLDSHRHQERRKLRVSTSCWCGAVCCAACNASRKRGPWGWGSALAVLASSSGVSTERAAFMDLVGKEIQRLNEGLKARGATSLVFHSGNVKVLPASSFCPCIGCSVSSSFTHCLFGNFGRTEAVSDTAHLWPI